MSDYDLRMKSLLNSLYEKYHICPLCLSEDDFFYAPNEQELVNHFKKAHHINDEFVIKEKIEPSGDLEYIILNSLIRISKSSKSKKVKRSKYFTVSNKYLYNELIKKSDLLFSNQKPRKILDELGLLTPYDNQRTKPVASHSKTRTRMYNINVDRLKEVISDTKYDDLKIKLALRDSLVNTIRPVIEPSHPSRKKDENNTETAKESRELSEPSRPSRKNDKNDDEKSRETRELDDDDIDWNIS